MVWRCSRSVVDKISWPIGARFGVFCNYLKPTLSVTESVGDFNRMESSHYDFPWARIWSLKTLLRLPSNSCSHGPLTRWVAVHRECKERFPCNRVQRKLILSDPVIHYVTCVTHVPWCMSGSLTRGVGENVPGIPGTCTTHNFTNLVRGPCHDNVIHAPMPLCASLWGRQCSRRQLWLCLLNN